MWNSEYRDPRIIHCSQLGDAETSTFRSKEILETIKRIYGLNCCILPLNSAPGADAEPATSTAWSEHLERSRATKFGSEQYLDSSPYAQSGQLLSEDDVKRLGGLVREMVAQSLIPWMERCVTQWNDSVSSLFEMIERPRSLTCAVFASIIARR
jgi:hypothetical protein